MFKKDVSAGIGSIKDSQKERRQTLLRLKRHLQNLTLVGADPSVSPLLDGYDPVELYWRVTSMDVWRNALVGRHAASRDYFDWAGPYLRTDRLTGADYERFWLVDVDAQAMPRNRLTSVVDFYQTTERVTAGNMADMLHANYVFDCDVFLTGDEAFHRVLSKALADFPGTAVHLLIDRGASSALSEIRRVLEHAGATPADRTGSDPLI